MAKDEAHKQAEIDSRTPEFMAHEATKPFGWESYHWGRFATIAEAFARLGAPSGSTVLDVGCGSGWTSLFLAEAGHEVTAVDIVPANVELTAARAARWGLQIKTGVADMETLELNQQFDLVLLYDALHHSRHHQLVLSRIVPHLKPGHWLLLGETTWLHRFSPRARRDSSERGWVESGFGVRKLQRDLLSAGLVDLRRFFQGTNPYESRSREFAWQLARLIAANFAVAPGTPIWLAARRPPS